MEIDKPQVGIASDCNKLVLSAWNPLGFIPAKYCKINHQ